MSTTPFAVGVDIAKQIFQIHEVVRSGAFRSSERRSWSTSPTK